MPKFRSIPNNNAIRLINSGSVKTMPPVAARSAAAWQRSIVATPIIAIGIKAIKPAIGPATPISNTALRDGIGESIFMNAPNVPAGPIIGGVGIKYGNVASTR